MNHKKLFWFPVVGLVLFFSFYTPIKKNKKQTKLNKLDLTNIKTQTSEPQYPQNIAARECEFNLN